MQESIPNEKSSDNPLRNFYNVVFRHKHKLILFFVCVMVAVTIGTLLMPDMYQSEAKLLLQIGRESINLDQTTQDTPRPIGITLSRKDELNSELEILTSEGLAARVVDSLGVKTILQGKTPAENEKPSPEPPEQNSKRNKAIRILIKNLNIEVVKESTIIELAYKTKSPRLAADVLSKLIECYLEKRFKIYRTEGAYDFFEQQKENLGNALAETEQEIKEIKTRTRIASLDRQQFFLLERKAIMQREIESTESAISASRAKTDVLQSILALLPERLVTKEITGGALSASDKMRNAVNELHLKENEILGSFTEKSIFAQEIRLQISAAKELLADAVDAKTVEMGLNETRQRLELALFTEESELSSLQAKSAILGKQMDHVHAELQTIIDTEVLLNRLGLEKELLEFNYRKHSRNLEQSRIEGVLEQAEISNVRVFQEPTVPLQPVSPKPLLNLFLGALLGLLGGLGLVSLTDYFDHTFKKPEDIEKKLNIPALGAIPFLHRAGAENESALSLRFDSSSEVKRYCKIMLEHTLRSKGTEELRRIFSITSCYKGEGASTVSAYLASVLAEHSDGRVLLVDAHLSNPLQHHIFDANLSPGLADILAGGKSQTGIIQPTSVDKLDLLCAGQATTSSATQSFESKVFTEMLNYWKNEYGFIIFDTPPLGEENHAVTLGKIVDGAILVVEAERVRWEVAQRAKERLTKSGTIIGGILNKRRFYVPDWLYKTL